MQIKYDIAVRIYRGPRNVNTLHEAAKCAYGYIKHMRKLGKRCFVTGSS